MPEFHVPSRRGRRYGRGSDTDPGTEHDSGASAAHEEAWVHGMLPEAREALRNSTETAMDHGEKHPYSPGAAEGNFTSCRASPPERSEFVEPIAADMEDMEGCHRLKEILRQMCEHRIHPSSWEAERIASFPSRHPQACGHELR